VLAWSHLPSMRTMQRLRMGWMRGSSSSIRRI
jgi:hypothetical protein